MADDDSLLDRARRAVSGPTPAERAAELDDRVDDDPSTVSDDELGALIDLLDADDPEAVRHALHALGSLVDVRPGFVAPAVPAVFDGLSARPTSEWTSVTLGEASKSFMRDLSRGSILLSAAEADPSALDPILPDLADRYGNGTLEPMTTFALAYAVAADPDRVPVDPASVARITAKNLRGAVESAAESDDEWTDLDLQPMSTRGYVDLLDGFDDDALDAEAVADARHALETAKRLSDDEDVVAAAEEALSDG